MKENFCKCVFVIDESGSMRRSKEDVITGFNAFIKEQKGVTEGQMNISLYKFNDTVNVVFKDKDIREVKYLNRYSYVPDGATALNDAIYKAIHETGAELSAMPEEERPAKVIFIIMTDGEENASKEVTLQQVKEAIKHQTEVYSWQFIYLGTDITSTKDADEYGFRMRAFSSRDSIPRTMERMSQSMSTLYKIDPRQFSDSLSNTLDEITHEYEQEIGQKIEK